MERLQGRLKRLQHERRRRDAWLTVEIARHKERPRTRDYIAYLIEGFEELKGDRLRADDPAIVGGLGWFGGRAVMVVGHQKGRTLDEQTVHNFGMARPEGYRKAQRLFALAERHGLPVLTFVDTPGAYPGVAAEEGGQARAIAETMLKMARLTVPVVATVIGEGGSGGALALAVADRVLMQENATYSVISPEGCAAILWRDAAFAPQAAEALQADGVAAPRAWRHREGRRGTARRRPPPPRGRGGQGRRGDPRGAGRARPGRARGPPCPAPRTLPPARRVDRAGRRRHRPLGDPRPAALEAHSRIAGLGGAAFSGPLSRRSG